MNAVQMEHITKTFGPVIANNDVNFTLKQGEIHALLGENGAGKTTLMRILYGLYQADKGDIFVNEKKVQIASPSDAIVNGIGMVTQHFTLVPTISVTETIILSEKKGLFLNLKKNAEAIRQASIKFGIPIEPEALVRHLSVGERQRVEILKALFRNATTLILDEPTAVLIPQEIDQLMEALLKLKSQNYSVVFISHKLNEVMAICDRISVLRDGNMIGTVNKKDVTQGELANMMVGRETFGVTREDLSDKKTDTVLTVDKICANDKKGLPALKEVSFSIKAGEILGVAGVSGNGQSELAQVLSGTLQIKSGSFKIGDKEFTKPTPGELVKSGVGRIPEERHSSVVGEMTLAENLVMEHIDEFTHNGLVDKTKMLKEAERLISDFNIKANPKDPIRTLSGGNMQKALLARTLSRDPKLIIVSQPTRGLDVGATEYLRLRLIEQAKKGAAILLISEDLDEILALSNRIAVIYEGKIMDILPSKNASIQKIGMLMAGCL
jgi:simple sugar transport system ATP-binding protein